MTSAVKVKVHTFEQELDFSIKASTTGKQLLEQAVRILRIYEVWYFGLQYVDKKGREAWIKKDIKVLKQVKVADETVCSLSLRVRFYPERVDKELIDNATITYFYSQAMDDIRSGRVTCNLEVWLVLASIQLFVAHGPHQQRMVNDEEVLSKVQLLKHYDVQLDDVASVLLRYYSQHPNVLRVEAMLEYLKIAENLPGYGVKYHSVTKPKSKHKELLLAVHPLGIDVHRRENRYSPEFGFKWSEIGDLSYLRKKFILQTLDTKGPNFVFHTATRTDVGRLLDDCAGTHDMYNFRRKSPTLEMKMLAKQCRDDRDKRKEDMILLATEKDARRILELENGELREAVAKIENDLSIYRERVKHATEEMEYSRRRDDDEKYLNVQEALAVFERKGRSLQDKMVDTVAMATDDDVFDYDDSVHQDGFLVKKLQSLIADLAVAKHKTEDVRSRLLQQDSLQSTLQKCKSILSMQEEQKKHKIVAFENM